MSDDRYCRCYGYSGLRRNKLRHDHLRETGAAKVRSEACPVIDCLCTHFVPATLKKEDLLGEKR